MCYVDTVEFQEGDIFLRTETKVLSKNSLDSASGRLKEKVFHV